MRGAAERLSVSQPTLTSQISALEQALGTTLIERSRGGTLPTPLGRMLADQAETVLNEFALFVELAQARTTEPVGTHRLGVTPTTGPYFLPHVIDSLHGSYPDLRLHVREDGPRDLEANLINGRHDFALTAVPLTSRALSVEVLFEEPLQLVAPPDHPLSAKTVICDADLQGAPLLALEDRYQFYDQVQELALRYGARLLREYAGTSLDTLRQMVGMGMGLGFLPALYVRSEILPRSDVAVLTLDPPPTYRAVGLAWRQSAPHRQLYRKLAHSMRRISRAKLSDVVAVPAENSQAGKRAL